MAIQKDRIDTSLTVACGAVASAWLVIIVLVIQGLLHASGTALDSERILVARPTDGAALETEQRASMLEYRWIERDAGRVRIPIDRAMDVVVDESVREEGEVRDG